MFPGKTIHIDCPCLDCGDTLRVAVRDGRIEEESPRGICGYVNVPISKWAADWPST